MQIRIYSGHTSSSAHWDVLAFLDLGADSSGVTRAVIERLGLAPTGEKARIAGFDDKKPREFDQYAVRIAFDPETYFDVLCTETGKYVGQKCLIGCDILDQGQLIRHGPLKTGKLILPTYDNREPYLAS